MQVYVVTQGDYSDFSVVTVCSTAELADHIAKLIDGDVEEYTIDAPNEQWALERLNNGQKPYEVFMYREGSSKIHDYLKTNHAAPAPEDISLVLEKSRVQRHSYGGEHSPDAAWDVCAGITWNIVWYVAWFLYGVVWAQDEQHAAKIANERRVQMIANNEWPPEQREKV